MKVHKKIRFMREERNWSQEEMAAKLNMSLNGYSKIERGETNVHIPKLEQIAEILEMDVIELMSLGEKCVYLSGNGNNTIGYNIIGSTELVVENQKLQLMLAHKDEIIEHLKQDVARLTELLALYKQKND